MSAHESSECEPREPSDGAAVAKRRARRTHFAVPMRWGEAIVLTLVSLAILALFVWIAVASDPDPRGHGTHEQLGLQPCSWPLLYDRPCPTCGVTTSVCWLVHGRPDQALWTQPFGFFLGCAGLYWLFASARALWRRESFVYRIAMWPLPWIVIGVVLLLLASWAWVDFRFESAGG